MTEDHILKRGETFVFSGNSIVVCVELLVLSAALNVAGTANTNVHESLSSDKYGRRGHHGIIRSDWLSLHPYITSIELKD